jgi:hypothetical protein
MVSTERRMRAETEDELKELKQEKEALRSALRLIDGENTTLRGRPDLSASQEKQIADMIVSFSRPPSRSSSLIAVRSRPASLDLSSTLPPLPPSPSPEVVSRQSSFDEDIRPAPIEIPPVFSPDEESQPTPKSRLRKPQDDIFMGSSPWADVTPNPVSQLKYSAVTHTTLH